MRKLRLAVGIWLGICALWLLIVTSAVVWAVTCDGYNVTCNNGYYVNTCCVRGCFPYYFNSWDYVVTQQFEKQYYGTMICCQKRVWTAFYYSCPDGEPACTKSEWWALSGYCPEP